MSASVKVGDEKAVVSLPGRCARVLRWLLPNVMILLLLFPGAVLPASAQAIPDFHTPDEILKNATAASVDARIPGVVAALKLDVSEKEQLRLASITGYNETLSGMRLLRSRNGQVKTGLDVAAGRGALFVPAARPASCALASRPCRVGLVTNQTGVDSRGRRGIDLLAHLPDVELRAIFTPEHGISGTLDTTQIAAARDAATGVPVYSVYGAGDADRRPSPEVLKSLDAVVFDLQDAGVRWYTYETTLGYFLEACAAAKLPIIVLDRPNPITGAFVQGAVSDAGHESFVNYHPLPTRHGMTMGELALLFNSERKIGAQLSVMKMQGWQRGDWFDATGLAWTNPSPNLRSLKAATLYPGVALLEGTNVSVGRGTETPFEILGAPWIEGRELAAYLNARRLSGVRWIPVSFTPASGPYAKQLCHGVHLLLTARDELDSPELGLEIASALLKLYPRQFQAQRITDLLVDRASFEALMRGDDPRRIADGWRERLDEFSRIRKKYLLY